MLGNTTQNSKKLQKVVTRFAPSPTGLLHAGNYRTALFAYLFARQHSPESKFILRIEDTDKARSKKEYEDNIIESLKWLGLSYDEFHRQSDRSAIHASYIQKLIDSGHAFVSKETPKNPGDRDEVIRFKNPNIKIKWDDLIRGEIEFDTTELGDFIIARSMQEPVFHLVVVVDDAEMGVTHIIRGEDHISNTSRHLLIYQALGFALPTYAHVPLLLSPDRTKLSKRKGALPITAYRDRGYLPEAIINYMAMLGWNPGTEQEVFSLDELVDTFDLSKVQKSGAIFNEDKLTWFNKHYIGKLSDADFVAELKKSISGEVFASPLFTKLLPLIREKISTFADATALVSPEGELSFAFGDLSYEANRLLWKGQSDTQATLEHLKKVAELLMPIAPADFSAENVKKAVWDYASALTKEQGGKGAVLWPMRYALSGKEKSPDPFVISDILGKDETLKRLNHAISIL